MPRLSTKQAQALVDKFNKQFPPGSGVYWRSINHPSAEYEYMTVRSVAFLSSGGTPVVFFEERGAYWSIEPEFVKYDEVS